MEQDQRMFYQIVQNARTLSQGYDTSRGARLTNMCRRVDGRIRRDSVGSKKPTDPGQDKRPILSRKGEASMERRWIRQRKQDSVRAGVYNRLRVGWTCRLGTDRECEWKTRRRERNGWMHIQHANTSESSDNCTFHFVNCTSVVGHSLSSGLHTKECTFILEDVWSLLEVPRGLPRSGASQGWKERVPDFSKKGDEMRRSLLTLCDAKQDIVHRVLAEWETYKDVDGKSGTRSKTGVTWLRIASFLVPTAHSMLWIVCFFFEVRSGDHHPQMTEVGIHLSASDAIGQTWCIDGPDDRFDT